MNNMIANQLQALWAQVENKQTTWEQFELQKKQWLETYLQTWRKALLFDGNTDLYASSMGELIAYLDLKSIDELEAWRDRATKALAGAWNDVDPKSDQSVQRFYDGCELELYNLLTWHTLREDDSPLSYVGALEFARPFGFKNYLDFGSGVGSGGILFGRNGYEVALADVSSPLLRFCRWRHNQRNLAIREIDLKSQPLPTSSFDFITAMDVFEHLVEPVKTAEQICTALKPGGILFGRFHVDPNDTHLTHIVTDFKPTFLRMSELGMKEIWQDPWLWGHQAFQKAPAA